MQFAFDKKSIYKNIKDAQVFEFSNEEATLILIGYPDWRAYISSNDSNVWVEIVPKIDITKKLIYLPKSNRRSINTIANVSQPEFKKKELELFNTIANISQPEFEKRKLEFFNTIPAEIVNIVKCYSDSHWEIIRAIKYISSDLIKLISSNPALAYILVHLEKFNPTFACYNDMELLKEKILIKQREILKISTFPGNDRIVKAILKLNPLDLSIKNLIKLKHILSDKSEISNRILNILSFSDKINKNLLSLLTENKSLAPILSNKVIFELIESDEYAESVSLLMEIRADCLSNQLKFPDIKSVKDIPTIREKINQKVKFLTRFPEHPIKGNLFIQPLTNEKELLSWSKQQENCIRDYTPEVESGKIFLYKVIIDLEEATLEVNRIKNGLKIGQLLGEKNRPVSSKLRSAVNEWFHQYVHYLSLGE
jgi:hypothetical protein